MVHCVTVCVPQGQGLVSTTEIAGGARIHYIFSDIYSRAIEEISFLDGLTEQDIRTSIKNSAGYPTTPQRPTTPPPHTAHTHHRALSVAGCRYRSALFVPETAFESLVKRQIDR